MSDPLPNRDGDWLWAQTRYEQTDLSADQIGKEIGESATSIISRASRHGWTRNKRANSVEASAQLVLAAKISKEEEIRMRLEAVEKVNAAMQAEVLAAQRQDIKKAKRICLELFDDLKEARADMDPDTRMGLMDSSMVMGRLAGAMKTFILLERQAHGIVGVIEDPELQRQQEMIPASTLDTVMEKFGRVLDFRREQQGTIRYVDVVENTGGSPR